MKKALCIIGLILGGIILNIALAYLNMLLVLSLYPAGFLLAAIIVVGISVLVNLLRRVYESKLSVRWGVFWCMAAVPSVVLGIGSMAWVYYLDSSGYWNGVMFGGLGEFILALALLIGAISFAIVLLVVLIIANIIRKRRQARIVASEKSEEV